MSEYYGYDICHAENELDNAVCAVNELLRVVCGDKAKRLANAVANNLYYRMHELVRAVDRELEQRQFKADFGYYVMHKCKSLAEARRYFAREMEATKNDRTLTPNVDFTKWKEKLDKMRSVDND